MTLAAIDRLVHHATILEMNVESYRRRAALDRKRGPGRPPAHATIKKMLANSAPRLRYRPRDNRRFVDGLLESLGVTHQRVDCSSASTP